MAFLNVVLIVGAGETAVTLDASRDVFVVTNFSLSDLRWNASIFDPGCSMITAGETTHFLRI